MDTWTLCSELINGKLCHSQEGPSGKCVKRMCSITKGEANKHSSSTVVVVAAVELRLRFLTDFTTL